MTPEGLRRPHALTGLGTEIYDYDANGNQTKRPGATVAYNALDQPKRITAANQPTTELFYDALGQRVRKRAFGSAETVTFDDLYERRLGNDTKHTFYVRAGSTLVAVVERSMQGTVVTGSSTRYVHPNHQGSIDLVTGASGAALQYRSYDPFGRARNPDWSTAAPPQGAPLLRRGFTEHEHDDEFGLVHMRGRTYDPRIGRFLQADPFVPNPLNGQSYNRYSYVRNSPPNLVDPSGYAECATDPCQKKDHLPGATLGADGVYHTADSDRTYWVREVTIVGDRREEPPPSLLQGPFPFGGGPVGGQGTVLDTDGTGCRGCDQGLDERRGGRWGGAEAGGWQSETDPGQQRSSEAHSPSPGYATDDAFGGTDGGPTYPPSSADARAMALARGVSQAWDERGGALIEKAAWAEMTALKVIWETIALQQVAQLGQTIGGALSKACFVAGTEVWTAEGLLPIEQVRAGQLVLSRDEATGELGWKVVVRTFVTAGQEVLALRLADAERGEREDVEATAEHPFWREGRGWVGAGELAVGQRVLRADGRWLRVEGVEARGGAQTVYNLEVDDFHTYVVGQLGAWVHNACGKEAIERAVQKGVDIVGKAGRAGPKPTQLEINPHIVKNYVKELRKGKDVGPVDVVELPDGRQFITEGHHRYVASQKTGIPVEVRVTPGQGPVGFDWAQTIYNDFRPGWW